MGTHLWERLGGILFLAGVFSSAGCATHGELVTLREELQTGLSQTRAYLNERIDKAADQLHAAEALQNKLKELQTVQQRQGSALDALQVAVKDLKTQPDALKRAIEELKLKADSISQEVARIHGSVRVWNDRFVHSLRTEQEELRNRLKTVDRSLRDVEPVGMANHTKTGVSHDREPPKH